MIWALFVPGRGLAAPGNLDLEPDRRPGGVERPGGTRDFQSDRRGPAQGVGRLGQRDLRDILGRLISLIRKPFKYQVRPWPVRDRRACLFIEGEKFNVQRVYRSMAVDPAAMPAGARSPSAAVNAFGSSGPPPRPRSRWKTSRLTGEPDQLIPMTILPRRSLGRMSSGDIDNGIGQLQRVLQANEVLQQSLAQDVQTIEAINNQINQINSRVLPIVESASRQRLGAEPDKWKSWWTDQLGYAFQASQPAIKPTFTEFSMRRAGRPRCECFGEGTLVHAAGGPRAIETIQVGDRVLTSKHLDRRAQLPTGHGRPSHHEPRRRSGSR